MGVINNPQPAPEPYVLPSTVATADNPLWDDLRVSLARATTGSANPTMSSFRDGVQAYAFSASQMNQLWFDCQIPHAWLEGSEVRAHIHWSPGNSTNTGAVLWGLEYTWCNAELAPGDTFPATQTVYFTDAAHGAAYSHQIAPFPNLDGTGKRVSSVLMCRVFRDATNGEDTFTGAAFALSLDFHIQLGSDGSVVEYPS
jgi:hypothetical protein